MHWLILLPELYCTIHWKAEIDAPSVSCASLPCHSWMQEAAIACMHARLPGCNDMLQSFRR